jgi:ectoine hydroxylase-related dioxygenase (phytanoyl-CoA dioxygenase family)
MASMVTLRVHLDDCDDDNAPLLIAPGSHLLGRVLADAAADVARNIGPVACRAKAGDVWLYATPILHASERARAPRRRRVLQVDYAATKLPDGLEWLGVMDTEVG